MAWFSAPAPTTCTSTIPDWRMTPAMAPATEFGFDLLDTLRISMRPTGPCFGGADWVRVRRNSGSLLPHTSQGGRYLPIVAAYRPTLRAETTADREALVFEHQRGVVRVGHRVPDVAQADLLPDALGNVDH